MTRIAEIEGWASIYDAPDLNGDTVARGAFEATLHRSGARRIKMLYQHAPETPVGRWRRFEDRPEGLYAYGEIVLSTRAAKEAYELVRGQLLDGLSIGYRTVRSTKGAGGRRILDAELWEVSLVTFPMAPRARITRFSAPLEGDAEDPAALADAFRDAAQILSV